MNEATPDDEPTRGRSSGVRRFQRSFLYRQAFLEEGDERPFEYGQTALTRIDHE